MEDLTPPLPGRVPISSDSDESGLWLWRGEVPSARPAAAARLPSRLKRVAAMIGSATRPAQGLLPPSGLVLIGLTLAAWVGLQLLPGGQSMPGKISAAAPAPARSSRTVRPLSPASPAQPIAAPPAQVQMPSVRFTHAMTEPTQHKTAKGRPRRRPPLTTKTANAFFAHRWTPRYDQQCRYQCDWAGEVAWHGGGY
jgi:hypothetical protein